MAIEVAEAVLGALKGELAATAVNAPMVPAEVYHSLLHLYATACHCTPVRNQELLCEYFMHFQCSSIK